MLIWTLKHILWFNFYIVMQQTVIINSIQMSETLTVSLSNLPFGTYTLLAYNLQYKFSLKFTHRPNIQNTKSI